MYLPYLSDIISSGLLTAALKNESNFMLNRKLKRGAGQPGQMVDGMDFLGSLAPGIRVNIHDFRVIR